MPPTSLQHQGYDHHFLAVENDSDPDPRLAVVQPRQMSDWRLGTLGAATVLIIEI